MRMSSARAAAKKSRSKRLSRSRKLLIFASLTALPALIGVLPADAQTTWVGNGTNQFWDVASNWNTGVVPNSSSNNVANHTNFQINYRQNTDTVDSFTADNGGAFLMSGGILNLVAAFTTNGAYSQTGGTLTAGSFNTSSSFSMSNGTMNVGSFTQTGTGTLTLSGGTLNDTGNLTTASTLLMNGGTIQNATIANAGLINFGNNTGNLFDNVTLAAGQGLTIINYNGGGNNTPFLQIADSFNFTSGVTFNIGTSNANNSAADLFFDSTSGNLNPTLNNATVNLGYSGGGGGYVGFGSGFSGTNETLTFGSGLVIQGSGGVGNIGYFGNGGANITNNGLINANIVSNGIYVSSGYNNGYNGTVTNNGTIEATANKASVAINAGTFLNTGTLQLASGSTGSISAGTATQTAGTTIVNGALTVTNLSNGTGTYNLQGGAMYGAGTITGNVNNTGATFGAGQNGATPSTGTLTMTGNYTQSASAIFSAALGGTASGSGFDFFTVSGSAVLGGYLDISLINGFVPTSSESFLIISDTSQSGTFANAAPNSFITDTSGRYLFQVIYGPNYVRLNGDGSMPEPPAGVLMIAFAGSAWAGLRLRRKAVRERKG